MRRTLAALALALILLFGSFCYAEGEPEIFSCDFDLRFHLNTEVFSFREREEMQGWADLMDLLEFRGNLSWCPETESTDLKMEIIPRTNRSAAVSFRMWGIPIMHRISSPLLGEKDVSFNPGAFLHFAISVREVFQLPLPNLALLNPRTTLNAFSTLWEVWKEKAGDLSRNRTVTSWALRNIAGEWGEQLENGTKISDWAEAVTDPVLDDGLALLDLKAMPEELLNMAGGRALTVTRKGETAQVKTAGGFAVWEETETENSFSCALSLPEGYERYFPSFSFRRENGEETAAPALRADWACAPETARTDPETGEAKQRIALRAEAEGLPRFLPADSSFTGVISQEGMLLPQFSFLLSGSTAADGKVRAALTFADRPEAGEVFSCEGTVTPAEHPEPMAYTWGELNTEYNILDLSYSAQGELIRAVGRPLVLGLIDFLYELPTSSCQSIMDYLEDSGVLRTVLQ